MQLFSPALAKIICFQRALIILPSHHGENSLFRERWQLLLLLVSKAAAAVVAVVLLVSNIPLLSLQADDVAHILRIVVVGVGTAL